MSAELIKSKPITVMLVAGEASGDKHAANMFLELKKQHPEMRGIGMGGGHMVAAGIDVSYDSSGIAVIGIVEVIKHYAEIRNALRQMQILVKEERPDLLVCVDYKEFNFKLAGFAKQLGIKVLFYVSPQVWAWRPNRVIKYGQVIDAMAVIFPFEVPYYQKYDIPVRYVGHPCVDSTFPNYSKEEDLQRFDLNADFPIIGLLPGSRDQEIKQLLPVMLDAAELIKQRFPDTQFILPLAESVSVGLIQQYVNQHAIEIICKKNQPYDVIQCCDAVMSTSGTTTLEVALLTIPMVIVYKLSAITYFLASLLVKTPFVGLPNIIAGKLIVKELIQHNANSQAIADEMIKILLNKQYTELMKLELNHVKAALGQGGGSKNMADFALQLLKLEKIRGYD